jgi:multimeric flavodoxin WrbA
MDILAICGSPRKKHTTHSILAAVLAGTGCSNEIIWPADLKIGHCTGCLACKHKTPGKCWQKDAMAAVLDKMYEARGLIIASPTYFGNVPGPLKNLIDRSIPTCYTGKGPAWMEVPNHGTRPFKGRPALIAAISGGGDHEKTAANIRLVLEYYEYAIVGEFVEGMGGVIVTREEHPDIYSELFSLGKKLGEAVQAAGMTT